MNKSAKLLEVSLVTPMYNESEHIKENIKCIITAMEELQIEWEYILVDDGSTDDSYEKAREVIDKHANCRIIHYSANRGRGFALRQGFNAAIGKYIISTESDLSWGPLIISSLYNALCISNSDIVIASVYLPGGGLKNVPLFRQFLSSWGNKVMRWSFGKQLTMVSGMTRGYRSEVIKSLYLQEDRKEIHLEIISKSQALGHKITEIPATITWKKPTNKKGKKRGGGGIVKFIIPHLLTSFDRGAFKILVWFSFLCVLSGVGFIGFGALNKIFLITSVPKPNMVTYGLILILVAVVGMLFAGTSLQLNNIYKSLVHIQSQLKSVQEENNDIQ